MLVPLPVVAPLVAAALAMATIRWGLVQRVVAVVGVATALGASVALLVLVERDGTAVVQVGGWQAPIGISLVADLFATLLLVVSMATVLVVLVFAIGHPGTRDAGTVFHPLYLVMTAGVAASFLTGDLFNLFVAFEVMLGASYVLITFGAGARGIRSGMTYVVIGLLASTLFITALGLVYAATGTMNMADLSVKLAALPDGVRAALGLLLLVVFGIKAGVFPLFFWLPDSYPAAPSPITAIFAGLLTKVGVYALIRSQTLLFPHDGAWPLLLVIAGLTMVVGVLGAIAQGEVKRILSFHIVSQIGYMVMGLALFTVSGIAGAIFFLVHQIPVKTSLFLVDGMVEQATGTSRIDRLSGLVRRMPVAAGLFSLAALSLAGLPPLSGFVGKLALVEAGFGARQWLITGVSLAVSLLTLFSMSKIWNGVFWGAPAPVPGDTTPGAGRLRVASLMTTASVALVGLTVAIAVAAGPVYDLAERAASGLLDPASYVGAVLQP